MSTSTNASEALKSVSAALSNMSIIAHQNSHISAVSASVTELLNIKLGSDKVAGMPHLERSAAIFNILQDANIKSVKAAYPKSWEKILTAPPFRNECERL